MELPPGEFGIPPADPTKQVKVRGLKNRWGGSAKSDGPDEVATRLGRGRTVSAGGMVYISSVGPIDLENGQLAGESMKLQAAKALENLKQRLDEAGSSLEKVVWVNWALRDPGDFDTFNEEWVKWFPGDMPVGQGTILPTLQRRAGFRISLGVIAEA